uniref:Transmembrane protein n=1 Tax=Lacunastrum gracillimum TaxID=427913 RepID=A0A2U8GH79_9CHLO|nr:hypothetical protein [Lacunastrum gracillimum]AWI68056.1 hypothetical protein [Lacunastrum gracillimum]
MAFCSISFHFITSFVSSHSFTLLSSFSSCENFFKLNIILHFNSLAPLSLVHLFGLCFFLTLSFVLSAICSFVFASAFCSFASALLRFFALAEPKRSELKEEGANRSEEPRNQRTEAEVNARNRSKLQSRARKEQARKE